MATISKEPLVEPMAVDVPQAIELSEEETNLIVNYLPLEMTDQELGDMFDEFGLINSVKIVRNKITGESKGFGFVNFELANNANMARIFLDGRQMGTKYIKVAFARPSSEAIKQAKIYVTHLPKRYRVDDVLNIFGRFGDIEEVKILRDKQTGESRGVALVHFGLKASAERAIAEMSGEVMEHGLRPLIVKLAERHKEWKSPEQRNQQNQWDEPYRPRHARGPASASD